MVVRKYDIRKVKVKAHLFLAKGIRGRKRIREGEVERVLKVISINVFPTHINFSVS